MTTATNNTIEEIMKKYKIKDKQTRLSQEELHRLKVIGNGSSSQGITNLLSMIDVYESANYPMNLTREEAELLPYVLDHIDTSTIYNTYRLPLKIALEIEKVRNKIDKYNKNYTILADKVLAMKPIEVYAMIHTVKSGAIFNIAKDYHAFEESIIAFNDWWEDDRSILEILQHNLDEYDGESLANYIKMLGDHIVEESESRFDNYYDLWNTMLKYSYDNNHGIPSSRYEEQAGEVLGF